MFTLKTNIINHELFGYYINPYRVLIHHILLLNFQFIPFIRKIQIIRIEVRVTYF
jgi:hypothetical protein